MRVPANNSIHLQCERASAYSRTTSSSLCISFVRVRFVATDVKEKKYCTHFPSKREEKKIKKRANEESKETTEINEKEKKNGRKERKNTESLNVLINKYNNFMLFAAAAAAGAAAAAVAASRLVVDGRVVPTGPAYALRSSLTLKLCKNSFACLV